MTSPSFGHRFEYALIRAVAWLARRLPESWAQAMGTCLGWLAGSVLRIRRRVVEENLARAFPDRGADWIRSTAAASFRHLGREGIALLRLADLRPEQIRERSDVEGVEWVADPLSRGQGVVIVTGHLGNWEIGGAILAARGVPLDVVAQRQSNPLFDRMLNATREGLGMTVIPRGEATRRVLRSLRVPKAVALVADQNVRSGGAFVEFFGIPASTARGPALLAERAGAAVVLAIVRRLPGVPVRYRFTLTSLPAPDAEDPETRTGQLLRSYLAGLEDGIRSAPEQYFWAHRRWKTRPEQEQPSVDPVEDMEG